MRTPTRFVALLAVLFASTLSAAAWAGETFVIDPVHSTVIFKNHHFNAGYVYGRFNNIGGSFTLDDDASKSSVSATVAVDSVDTANKGRDDHLKGPDFFNAKQFPEITFKSTSVSGSGDKLEVVGDLTLHGVTKSVTVVLNKTGLGKGMKGETRAGLEGSFTVKRTDFGMDKMVGPSGDEVTLIIALEGVKQ